jgi:F5/8 type C domain-containing protein
VQVSFTANTGGNAAQLSEFEAFPGGGGGTTTPNSNLPLDQPTTASGYTQTYVPSNVVDGKTSTYWESTDKAFPPWFQVDLGSPVSVSRIVMDLQPSSSWGTRTQTITIRASTDGTNYPTLARSAGYTFDPSSGNTVKVTLSAATVRYLKLTFTANTGWPVGQLPELQVYSG